ncbi:MAG: PorP/SprF family type IX secretion system membrane protein [Bacteroidota bacterium]
MRRIILAVLLVGATAGIGLAQSDSHFSLFNFNTLSYNPAYAGSNEAICITSVHRQQWTGFGDGRPQTTVFSADMPLPAISSGVGLNVMQESIGFEKNLNLYANYAYRLPLTTGTLSLGLSLGLVNKSLDGDWVSPGSLGGDPVYIDPAIPHMDSKMAFDAGFGAYYRYDNFYAGVSALHLLEPKFKFNANDDHQPKLARHYYIVSGYIYQLPDPSFEVKPSIVVQTDMSALQFSVNGQFIYNKKFWGGVTYRYSDAVVPMVGIHLMNGISVGYSYDVILSDIASFTSGSHELVLRYCFNADFSSTPGRYRSVRRL